MVSSSLGGLDRLGFQKTTLVDYPGHIASVIFTAGCLLRCPYCQNAELIHGEHPSSFVSRDEILRELRLRSARVRHVVVTGGEPLMHVDLPKLFDDLAAIGYTVKLDTCGMLPDELGRVLAHPALAFVAMDIKCAPRNYARVNAPHDAEARLHRSMSELRAWRRAGTHDFEFRTVVDGSVARPEDLASIVRLIGSDRWTTTPVNADRRELNRRRAW